MICACSDTQERPDPSADSDAGEVLDDARTEETPIYAVDRSSRRAVAPSEPDAGPDCQSDCDQDGLSDCRESELGTRPCVTDSDGDGLNDKQEIDHGSDPLDPDTDSDGATDGEEVDLGLDPTRRSTYDDGADDGTRWILGACDDPTTEPVQAFTHEPANWKLVASPSLENYVERSVEVGDGFTAPVVATYEDPSSGLSGLMMSYPSHYGDPEATRDAIEQTLRWFTPGQELDMTVEEREFSTHEDNPAATGSYEFAIVSPTTPTILTARVWHQYMRRLMSITRLRGRTGARHKRFSASVGVIHRVPDDGSKRTLVNLVTVPTSQVDRRVRRLMDDLTNTTGISAWDRGRETRCRRPLTRGRPKLDVYWVVDQSRSMVDDYDALLEIAGDFYDTLVAQQMDFRMGVTTMEQPRLGVPLGSSPWHHQRDTFMGLLEDIANDPFDGEGQFHDDDEYGMAVARSGLEFMMGLFGEVPPSNVAMRPDALAVTVFAADENSERFQLYPPDTSAGQHALTRFIGFFEKYTTAFAVTTSDAPSYDLVALGTGGAAVSMNARPDERRTVLERFTLDLAAEASTYQLASTPITSTMHVLVDGRWIPRSREHGYDYFPDTNSIVFFGRHQPTPPEDGAAGDRIAVMYEVFANPPK